MKGKILLVVGVGVGYVLGAKAGRERYEDIKRITDKFWNSKGVQKQVDNAEGFVKDRAPEVAGFVARSAKKVATNVTSKKKSTTGTDLLAEPIPGYSSPEK